MRAKFSEASTGMHRPLFSPGKQSLHQELSNGYL
uniref:Uncharacterized protein n=1 Tax=Rhizophora mucronata TaxID=61149 RepID=A0A2P2IHX1_RHIMU